ncbi:MAG: hypothetical protein JWL70_782 [Acidimicrobiia bacterium]|nr:hypothetical protein [Acidimicrobiia bacterium]
MKVADRPASVAVGAPVDPRVRARRIQVRRAVGRRRFWMLVAVVAPVLIGLLMLAALWSPLVGVRTVEVVGTTQLDPAAVRQAAALGSTPMIKVSATSVRNRVSTMPLVGSVEVQRQWPGTVKIVVTERHPVVKARAADGSWREVDLTGRVLAARADRPALTLVEGPVPVGSPGSSMPGQAATAVRAAAVLPATLRPLVTKVTWDVDGNASLILGSGVPVRLGSTDQIAAQMVALSALLSALGMSPVAQIDLTVPDRPVVDRPAAVAPANPGPNGTKNKTSPKHSGA